MASLLAILMLLRASGAAAHEGRRLATDAPPRGGESSDLHICGRHTPLLLGWQS